MSMDRLEIEAPWLGELLPEGLPLGTSTLITGPGGSGKPLIGNVVVASWLKAGGSVVFMSLQYPSTEFIATGLKHVTGETLADHQDRVAFLELDATMDGLEEIAPRHIRGNLVKPPVWREALDTAVASLPGNGPGVLVFGSALNLLLFSPTYGRQILDEIKKTLSRPDDLTFLFSVSSSAKKEMIVEVEDVADNLLVSHSSRDPFRLFLRVERMSGVPFSAEEVEVPIAEGTLTEIKAVADHSRKRVIPQVSSL